MSDHEIVTVEQGTAALISRTEIDQQIATAHRFPRSIKAFRDEAMQLVTLTQEVAEECIYALPRDGKTIEGPSARFAEIMAMSWGNNRAGARVVDEGREFVTAQGVFHDLEKNAAITYEVKRRIVDKRGNRYRPDMIGVTANAACSIALRNAVLKGIPKALWRDLYEAARKTVMGDFQTLANRREMAMASFQKYGVKPEQVLTLLTRAGTEEITLDDLVTLRGVLTAIREGDTTPEQVFSGRTSEAETPGLAERFSAQTPDGGGGFSLEKVNREINGDTETIDPKTGEILSQAKAADEAEPRGAQARAPAEDEAVSRASGGAGTVASSSNPGGAEEVATQSINQQTLDEKPNAPEAKEVAVQADGSDVNAGGVSGTASSPGAPSNPEPPAGDVADRTDATARPPPAASDGGEAGATDAGAASPKIRIDAKMVKGYSDALYRGEQIRSLAKLKTQFLTGKKAKDFDEQSIAWLKDVYDIHSRRCAGEFEVAVVDRKIADLVKAIEGGAS